MTPANGTSEYSWLVSEVDACNQAQYRMLPSANVKAMRVSTASPLTYRPILFSPSA